MCLCKHSSPFLTYLVGSGEHRMSLTGSFSPGTSTAKLGSVATLLTVWHLRIGLDFAELIIPFRDRRSGESVARMQAAGDGSGGGSVFT